MIMKCVASSRKMSILFGIIAFNAMMFLVQYFAESRYVGTIEALGHTWTTHSTQRSNLIETQNHFASLAAMSDSRSGTLNFKYVFEIIDANKYISSGNGVFTPIRHVSVFYIDEQCSLVFGRISTPKLESTALRCQY